MAKYSKKAQEKVGDVMREMKKGKLRSGKGGKGGKVTSRKQAIAIGLSEAREEGDKVPKKQDSKKSDSKKSDSKKDSRSSSKKDKKK